MHKWLKFLPHDNDLLSIHASQLVKIVFHNLRPHNASSKPKTFWINWLKMMKTSQICKTSLPHFLTWEVTNFFYINTLQYLLLFTCGFEKK